MALTTTSSTTTADQQLAAAHSESTNAPTTNAPTVHHLSRNGASTFRTKSLPASGAVLPPPPPSDVVLTTPVGDPWPRPYYFEDGLRRVMPYHYTYNTYCKERWRKRPLLEIFADEFRDRPPEYYRSAIERGLIQVNGKQVSTEHQVQNGDVVSHTLHRHEPPVTAQEIGIVHEDANMIVVDKPAGVPVHPAGRYNYNSLVEILRATRNNAFNPMPCNRLDRLTSGIMFVGKTKHAAEKLGDQIRGRTVRKEYVARVVGEFPEGEVVCDQPILQISPKLGLNRVRANGKDAKTVFRRLAYYPPAEPSQTSNGDGKANGDNTVDGPGHDQNQVDENGMPWKRKQGYSIVRCAPITGRTHQLRVHLQFLGHPITNDPIYCNQRVFGHRLGRSCASADDDESVLEALAKMGKSEAADAVAYHDEMVGEYLKRKAEKQTGQQCEICGTELYSDPGLHELGIYLHALRYSSMDGSWDYRTELPAWALPPEGVQGPTGLTEESDPLTAEAAALSLDEATEGKKREAKAGS